MTPDRAVFNKVNQKSGDAKMKACGVTIECSYDDVKQHATFIARHGHHPSTYTFGFSDWMRHDTVQFSSLLQFAKRRCPELTLGEAVEVLGVGYDWRVLLSIADPVELLEMFYLLSEAGFDVSDAAQGG